MKPVIRTPYFEVGTKNYVYGDQLLEYAIAADKAAQKYDIDVLFICSPIKIRRVRENTKNLIVLAPYMDTLRPGRGMADILPEGLKALSILQHLTKSDISHRRSRYITCRRQISHFAMQNISPQICPSDLPLWGRKDFDGESES